MINIRELRIGNKLLLGSQEVTVKELWSDEINTEEEGFVSCGHPQLGYIPLTEDWLLRGGFEKNDDPQMHGLVFYRRFGDLKISTNYVAPRSLFLIYLSGPFGMVMLNGISHVHQLQNLVNVLTNKDLTFTEKL